MTIRKMIASICVAALMAVENVAAQTADSASQSQSFGRRAQIQHPKVNENSDAALEIAPRTGPLAPPAEGIPEPTPTGSSNLTNPEEELPPVPTSGPPPSMVSIPVPRQQQPYLGVSVQRIESHST